MASIHQLSAKTSHSLSMGQVVTSVFSVVKELLENALDAGATSVDVRLDDYGLEKIEVRDDGSGLMPEDVAVMGQAHYTSKLQHLDDMGSLSSFGFRGEALSAVCASCEVTVATRTAADEAGRLVTLDATGAVVSQRLVARAQGTTVTASSLFSRQPVRRQLYGSARKRRDDLKSVEALLAATAVSRPPLRLALHHNGCQLLNKAPCDSTRSAALQVLKSEAARLLQPLTLTDEQMSVEALLPGPDAPPKVAGRSTGDQCHIIVNGRVINYKKVEKLLRDRFSSRHGLSPARTPVSVVHITVPPDQLDVNLEPNKTRLLLLSEDRLLKLLEDGLAEFYRVPVTDEPENLPGTVTPDQPAAAAAGTAAGTEPVAVDGVKVRTEPAPDASTEPTTASAAPAATTPGVTARPGDGVTPVPGVTFDEAARHVPAPAVTSITGGSSDPVTAPVTAPVTQPVVTVTAVPGTETALPETDGVPDLSDIQWDASESLFGDNFLGVVMDGGEPEDPAGRQPPAARDGHSAGRGTGTARPDPWATGRLVDSQGEAIEPTKLVTSYGEPASKPPKIQPSIREAFGSSGRPQSATNGYPGAGTDPPGAGAGTGTPGGPTAAGGGGSGSGGGSSAPAVRPPAKRPRPTEPGEPVYEPVASQVVRRAGTAFHYYCRDMRRKYLSLDPSMDIGKLSAALADGWKAALPSVRRQFEGMAQEDEKRYKEDVRKAKLAELIRTPQKTITDFCRVDTELRRMVAPVTPEARALRSRRPTQKLSVRGLREEVERTETASGASGDGTNDEPRLIGPLESHHAWVVLRSSQLLLVNPLRLSETSTLCRLLASYRFPCQSVSPPLPLTSATLGDAAHSTLCRLPRDGSGRVTDIRLEANGFSVEVTGEVSARLVAVADCINFYGKTDLAEVLRKVASGAETLTESRPARVVSWLKAEAVRISQGGGALMSREEVASLVHDTDDLGGECFHGRPLAAPLYELVS